MPEYTLSINDKLITVDADAGTPLLWVLRDISITMQKKALFLQLILRNVCLSFAQKINSTKALLIFRVH